MATRLIFGIWPEAVAKPIAEQVNEVLNTPRGGLLTFGAVLALYFSSSAIEALRTGLNRAYDVPETRRWYWLRLQSILFMTVASFALLALAFLGPAFGGLWSPSCPSWSRCAAMSQPVGWWSRRWRWLWL